MPFIYSPWALGQVGLTADQMKTRKDKSNIKLKYWEIENSWKSKYKWKNTGKNMRPDEGKNKGIKR